MKGFALLAFDNRSSKNSISQFLRTKMPPLSVEDFVETSSNASSNVNTSVDQSAVACALDRFNALEAELNFFSCALQDILRARIFRGKNMDLKGLS